MYQVQKSADWIILIFAYNMLILQFFVSLIQKSRVILRHGVRYYWQRQLLKSDL